MLTAMRFDANRLSPDPRKAVVPLPQSSTIFADPEPTAMRTRQTAPHSTLEQPAADSGMLAAALMLALLAVVHVVLTRVSWQGAVLQTDAAMWAYIGRRILDGAVPYRDLWESKPPGIYYIFAAVQHIFGQASERALLWLDGLVTCGLMGLTYRVARRFAARPACLGIMLPLSLVLGHRILADWGNNVEKFTALFEMAAGVCLLAAGRPRSLVRWWLAGLCCGLALLFKQTGVVFLSVTLAAAVGEGWDSSGLKRILPGLLVVAGVATVWAPVGGGLHVAGAGDGFCQQVLKYDLLRVGGAGGERSRLLDAEHWQAVLSTAWLGLVLFGPALVGGVMWCRCRRIHSVERDRTTAADLNMMLWYAGLALGCFAVAPYGYGHYLLQAAPPAAVLAAWAFDRTLRQTGRSQLRYLLASLLLLGTWALRDHLAFTLQPGYLYRLAYTEQRRRVTELAEVIATHTDARQSVMVWPTDYAVSYYAARNTPLECSNSDVIFKGKIHRLSPPMPELLARLRDRPPQVIVDWSPVEVEFTGSGPGGTEAVLLTTAGGFSLWEEPMPDHVMLEGRMLAPLKAWVRGEYGGQQRIGGCTFFHHARPWRSWQEVLLGEVESRRDGDPITSQEEAVSLLFRRRPPVANSGASLRQVARMPREETKARQPVRCSTAGASPTAG